MDIVVEGSSTVSNTPLLIGDDCHDHDHDHNAEAQVGRGQGNSIAEVPSSNDDDNYDDTNTNNEEEQVIVAANDNNNNNTITTTSSVFAHRTIINDDINDNSNEDERELLLLLRSSVTSFWNNYVKYYGYFSRWLFLVIVINIFVFVRADVYPINNRFCPNDENGNNPDIDWIWQYQLSTSIFQFILLATSIWFFTVAKVIDQQVINLDRMVQYEQAATTASEDEFIDTEQQQQQVNNTHGSTVEVGSAATILRPRLVLHNYDNIYGQVSRRIDRLLQQQQQLPLIDEDLMLSTTTSCLINFSYILWSLFLAASFHGITNLVVINHLLSLSKESFCVDNDGDYLVWIRLRTMIPSTVSACLILMVTSYWLLIREGVPSGIVPFAVAIVELLQLLIFKAVNPDRPYLYFEQMVLTIIVMVSGTILLHITLYCCYSTSDNHNNNNTNSNGLYSWVTRSLLIWALYGWIGAFWAFKLFSITNGYDYYFDIDEIGITALVLLAVTGILLQHPIIQLMGIGTVLVSFFLFFFGIGIDFLVMFLMGFGLIAVGNWVTKNINMNTIITGCWYVYTLFRYLILCRCFSH